jgi:uncharacterized protein YegP (UPF0339 family)
VTARFEVYEDNAQAWRWRLVAGNGEIVATSEAYTRKADARRGARTARSAARLARVVS